MKVEKLVTRASARRTSPSLACFACFSLEDPRRKRSGSIFFLMIRNPIQRPALKQLLFSPQGKGEWWGWEPRRKWSKKCAGRREQKGRETGFPRWREAEEIGRNYTTLNNSLQAICKQFSICSVNLFCFILQS